MSPPARNTRDLAAGLLYVFLGAAAMYLARDYEFGSASRMGPAFFPSAVGCCVAVIGVMSILRSMVRAGEALSPITWRPLLLVPTSVILFAFALPRVGLIPALASLLLTASLARRGAAFSLRGIISALALIVFCGLVFRWGLGQPIALIRFSPGG